MSALSGTRSILPTTLDSSTVPELLRGEGKVCYPVQVLRGLEVEGLPQPRVWVICFLDHRLVVWCACSRRGAAQSHSGTGRGAR